MQGRLAGERVLDKALVVEDDAGWRNILDELVTHAGFQVRTCASFGDAFGYLRRENFALAVIDLSLKATISWISETDANKEDLDGYQLLATTKNAGIPTIVVIGIAEAESIERRYAEL